VLLGFPGSSRSPRRLFGPSAAVTSGLEAALFEKQRPGAATVLDDRQKQRIIAMVCSDPPEGRNWPVHTAMPRKSENPRPTETSPRESCLDPPYEPRPDQDQLAIRPPSSPSEVWLQMQTVQAVIELAPETHPSNERSAPSSVATWSRAAPHGPAPAVEASGSGTMCAGPGPGFGSAVASRESACRNLPGNVHRQTRTPISALLTTGMDSKAAPVLRLA